MPNALSRASVAHRVETCELNNRGRTPQKFRSNLGPKPSLYVVISSGSVTKANRIIRSYG